MISAMGIRIVKYFAQSGKTCICIYVVHNQCEEIAQYINHKCVVRAGKIAAIPVYKSACKSI